MNKHELADALTNLALDTKEIVVSLHQHYPESGKAEELRGAAEIMLNWVDWICEEGESNE